MQHVDLVPGPPPSYSAATTTVIHTGSKEMSEPTVDIADLLVISIDKPVILTLSTSSDTVHVNDVDITVFDVPPVVFDWFETPLKEALSLPNDCFSPQFKPPPTPLCTIYPLVILAFLRE